MITKDFNLGTILSGAVFVIAQTSMGIWWAATISGDVAAMRAWQVRQDDRLVKLEAQADNISQTLATNIALLEIMRDDIKMNNELLLEELRDGRQEENRSR